MSIFHIEIEISSSSPSRYRVLGLLQLHIVVSLLFIGLSRHLFPFWFACFHPLYVTQLVNTIFVSAVKEALNLHIILYNLIS
jgi:hypothetical protein